MARPNGAAELLAAQLRLGRAPRLPSRAAMLAAPLAGTACSAVLLGAAVWATRDDGGVEIVGTVTACFAAIFVLLSLMPDRHETSPPSGSARAELPDRVLAALRRVGITSAELRVGAYAERDRAIRSGRRGWVVLSGRTAHDEPRARFTVAHHLAHLARHEVVRRWPGAPLAWGLAVGSLFTGRPAAIALLVGGGLLHRLAANWSSEFAADVTAARWAGLDAMRAWAREPEPPRGSLPARLRDLLRCPPARLRLAVVERRAAR